VLYGGWRTVTVPVRVNGTPTWGIQQLPAIGYQPQPVYVDWISLASATPGYTTVGNKIVDPSGQAVTPRGVNRNSLEVSAQGWWLSDNDFEAMRLWGATIVRLPLSQQFWLSSSCSYDPGYAARVDQAVQSITKRGMLALIDLHTTAAGQSCGTPRLSVMADDYSLQFWNQVASRYLSNPLVAFDLFNEPRATDDAMWHDGGMVGTWHAVGMQKLYDAVRATGSTNLVFVGGEGWAYRIDVALRRPIDGYGIVYSTHVYNKPDTGPLPSTVDSVIPPVAAKYPVMITEFGTTTDSGTYNANVIAYAESKGIGWSAWLWGQGPASGYALLQSYTTYAPTAAGQPVRAGLWKAKGWTTWGR
jgi:aryl-phospho-beta-D-glucosidase BglC (GH1 family)